MTLRDHLGPRTPENAALHDELDRLLAARAVALKDAEDAGRRFNGDGIPTAFWPHEIANAIRALATTESTEALDRLLAARAVALGEARNRINETIAERQADLHGARNDFNKGAVDSLMEGHARIRSLATTDSTEALGRVIRAHVQKALKYAAGCAQQEATNCNEVGDRNGMRACERIANCLLTDSTADDVLREMGGRGNG